MMYSRILLKRPFTTIPLAGRLQLQPKSTEITVYIKGFLSKGESSSDFTTWLDTHNKINFWNKHAVGWYWPCGYKLFIPAPVTSAYVIYKGSTILRFNPLALTAALSIDLGINIGYTLLQYINTEENTTIYDKDLAAHLTDLSNRYGRVRVVAHSLGCKLLLNALEHMSETTYPNFIHLLAPAVIESEYFSLLDKFQKVGSKIYVYHCHDDFMLNSLLALIKDSEPIGSIGLIRKYDNIWNINVGSYFTDSWFVHRNYKDIFDTFITNENKLAVKETYDYDMVRKSMMTIKETYDYGTVKKSLIEQVINDKENDIGKDHPEYLDYNMFSEFHSINNDQDRI